MKEALKFIKTFNPALLYSLITKDKQVIGSKVKICDQSLSDADITWFCKKISVSEHSEAHVFTSSPAQMMFPVKRSGTNVLALMLREWLEGTSYARLQCLGFKHISKCHLMYYE